MRYFSTSRRRFHHLWLIWGCIFFILVLAGCSDKRSSQPAAVELSDEETLILHGKSRARACIGCHGPNGVSRIPSNPSLAGLSQKYISEQLHAFRDGSRSNPIMSSMARNLNEKDIAALSHYFASLPAPSTGMD